LLLLVAVTCSILYIAYYLCQVATYNVIHELSQQRSRMFTDVREEYDTTQNLLTC
jgi:hypothetical protein